MDICGQLHAPAAPESQYGHFGGEKNLYLYHESNQDFSNFQHVA